MFNLETLINTLRYGDLSSTSIGVDGFSDLDITKLQPKQINRIINITNNVLVDICSNLPVFTKQLDLMSVDFLSLYKLSSEYALSNSLSNEPIKYILDSPRYPFNDDILYITNVTNEIGKSLPINDREAFASVFIPSYNVIQLTHVGYNQIFNITYRASHPIINLVGSSIEDTLNQEINLPSILRDLLLKKVASIYYSSMGGSDNNNTAQKLEGEYQLKLNNIIINNTLGVSDLPTNVKANRKGFI